MLTCAIDFNVNDRPSALLSFIKRLRPILDDPSIESAHIDLTKCQYIGPDAAAILGALLLQRKQLGKILNVSLPVQPPALVAFCEYIGLKHWLHGTPAPERQPS